MRCRLFLRYQSIGRQAVKSFGPAKEGEEYQTSIMQTEEDNDGFISVV
jgi:hypothetical protein